MAAMSARSVVMAVTSMDTEPPPPMKNRVHVTMVETSAEKKAVPRAQPDLKRPAMHRCQPKQPQARHPLSNSSSVAPTDICSELSKRLPRMIFVEVGLKQQKA